MSLSRIPNPQSSIGNRHSFHPSLPDVIANPQSLRHDGQGWIHSSARHKKKPAIRPHTGYPPRALQLASSAEVFRISNESNGAFDEPSASGWRWPT